jgi:aminocarboxymuconate-semialdehyde decarboxylase
VIDFHAHFVPASGLDAVAASTTLPAFDAVERVVTFPSGRSRPVAPSLTDLGGRAEWMAANGVDIQILSPWTELTGDDLDRSTAAEWIGLLNDAGHDEVGDDPGFRLLAALPGDPHDAVAELDRCLSKPGFVGGALPTQFLGTDLDTAGLDDLFALAEQQGVPLFVHPGRVMEPARMSPYFLSNVCGYPFETTLAALRLFFSGTFDRHPGLAVVLAHCGGTLPLLAGRAAHVVGRVPAVPGTTATPAEILDCFYFDTVMHDPMALGFAMRRVGLERMVTGTDAPFPMAIDHPAEHLRSAIAEWPATPPDRDPGGLTDLTARRLLGL